MRSLLFKLFIPLVAVLGIIQPFYSLCVYIAFTIVRPEMFFWGGRDNNMIFKISLIATFIGFIRLKINPKSVIAYKEFWLLLWIWFASTVSLWLSKMPLEPRAWYYNIELLKLWLLGFLILGVIHSKQRLVQIQNLSLFCVSFLSIWGIEQHFRGNERLEGLGAGAYGDSNGVAAVGVLYGTIALNNFLTTVEKKNKFMWLAAFLVITGMIISTQSRGGFLGLLASVAYLLLRTRKKKALIISCLLASIVMSPFIAQDYMARLESIGADEESRDYSAASRMVLWTAGVLMFMDHPITGVGTLNFAKAKLPYKNELQGKFNDDLLDYSFRDYKVGHGTYFTQLLAEGGLLQTIPYLWLISGFLIGAIRVSRENKDNQKIKLIDLLAGIEAGVVGHCISILFINALFMYFLPIQIIIGNQLINCLKEK